jgi:hypothetical protein
LAEARAHGGHVSGARDAEGVADRVGLGRVEREGREAGVVVLAAKRG